MAAEVGKSEPINRAVAADANSSGKQRVARDLPGNAASIELEDDFMARDFAQIIRICLALLVHAQFAGWEFQFGEELFAFSAIEIENSDRLATGATNFAGK